MKYCTIHSVNMFAYPMDNIQSMQRNYWTLIPFDANLTLVHG